MKRYIDANKAKEVFHYKTGGSSFDSFIDDVPTADVEEVVRCKDCKFAYKNRFLGEYYCKKTNCKIKQHHFCSCGERRAEE